MNWLNFIGFFIIGFVLFFTVLFIIVCIFDKMIDEHFKLEKHDEWSSEEIERNTH